ncbi:MAG: rhodanese-like domain-containing protein [Desulfobacterales bacterium]|nr:rhodanese-like domain-containing protein [Desulfobacterales bacterium]MDD4073689.1 rhodanese-like domain-containing protein [Desulfobacterales bacterium]MDD4392237.1 rhodanese-like domain-containing protein [Desulfobacterales bacterium]
MIVQSFFIKGISHSSYLLGGSRSCAIIDPDRHIQMYLDAAKELGMTITHILETHLHADFISGHMDLAEKTGADIHVPTSGKCKFPHIPVSDGSTITIDDIRIKVMETPGHTPEHVSYVVTDTARGKEPVAVFCGDTLFVGDAGRPDLFPAMAEELASRLYYSLHDTLLKLPDFCEVYPAHGAGSLCGRAMGAKRSSTIGYEKRYNAALQISNRHEFVRSLTTNMPPAPDHFSRCSDINRRGPSLVRTFPAPVPLTPEAFSQKTTLDNTVVLDVRSYDAFGGQHVPESYHIDMGGNFATFAGWTLPHGAAVLLVSDSAGQAQEAAVWLQRVGMDNISGFLDGGMFTWAKAGLPCRHVPQLSAEELYHAFSNRHDMVLIDVRSASEYDSFHIENAINIPAPDLRHRFRELDPERQTVLLCGTGHRSSLGASILKQHHFDNVLNVAGGMTGYSASGYSPACPVCFNPHGPHFMGQVLGKGESL